MTVDGLISPGPKCLPGYTQEQFLAKHHRREYNALESAVEHQLKVFYALQLQQEVRLAKQFKERFPLAKTAPEAYSTALDTVVKLEFAHTYLDERLPEHIREYVVDGTMPFTSGGFRSISDRFFAVQRSIACTDETDDLKHAAGMYRVISREASLRYQELLALNNVGEPAVQLLRHYLSGAGAHIFYLGKALEEDAEALKLRRQARSRTVSGAR